VEPRPSLAAPTTGTPTGLFNAISRTRACARLEYGLCASPAHSTPSHLSAVFAVQQVAHRLPASFVCFFCSLALVGVHPALTGGGSRFGDAAVRAAVGEARFIRLQLELFTADGADLDGEKPFYFYDTTRQTLQKGARA
jgi:hypothetical protein